MASQIKVNEIIKQSGSSIGIGETGDTISLTGNTINLGTTGNTVNIAGSAYAEAGTNTPAFHAYLSSNQSVSSGTATKININTELYDTGGGYDTSNYKFVVPSGGAGKYYIYGSAQTTSSSDFDDYQVKIYVNGSNYAQARVRHHYAECINVVTQANLSVSDYVELYVYSGSAVDIFGADECSFFGAYKIIGA